MIELKKSFHYEAVDVSKVKDFKIMVFHPQEKKMEPVELGKVIRVNGFYDPLLEKALETNNKAFLTNFFVSKYKYFTLEKALALNADTGEEVILKNLLKVEKKEPKILYSDFEKEIRKISTQFPEVSINNDDLMNLWYKRLKYYSRDTLARKIDCILEKETYTPKLSTFMKY